ncbi:Keratin, type I cytoskeletal 18 [Saguinus oedipus]|uniref:Keratin, type I cytoskeletal 18 n=1 Tax=Saguinus oedipus TaxID=9490 RepID=A0ABQ9W827_SAGOE|nr:Keratin, type I cytoskeletal 18 [Saguinus oedipus]
MSFTRFTFSANYQSQGSVQLPSYCTWWVSSAASVCASAGDSGSQISMSHSTRFCSSLGSGVLAMGMARGLARMGGIQNKETMQSLNDCLASFLERVRSLKTEKELSKIREHLEQKGPKIRDWGHCFKTVEDLRAQSFTNTVDNAHIILQISNASLATDDFRVKSETELYMCLSVDCDIHELHS